MVATTVEVYKPRLTSEARGKIKKLEQMGIDNVVSIANGMLLRATEERKITLKEIKEKYNHYLKRFISRFYVVPGFVPYCSLEDKLEMFVEYNYVKRSEEQNVIKYKLTDEGEILLRAYLDNKELLKLFP